MDEPGDTLSDVRPQRISHISALHQQLPDDLVDESLRRLGSIALAMAALYSVTVITGEIFSVALPLRLTGTSFSVATRLFFIAISTAMFFVARSNRLGRWLKSDLGVLYEVIGAVAIVAVEVSILDGYDIHIGPTSTVVIWLMLVRLMVPMALFRATIATGTAAAAAMAARIWLAELDPDVDLWLISGMMEITFGAALIAVYASRSVYHLGTSVTQARELGAYQLEQMLGRGGMGEVWSASHRMLKRPAAIKLIRPDALGPRAAVSPAATRERFEREAQITASLRSTHTIQLYDYGQTDDGSFYYVMELLDGIDLATLVEKYGPIPAERAVHLLWQVCHSLADAHDKGMIHRDIKPANIFLCKLGPDYDFIKVLDFGLVKETGTPGDSDLTADTTVGSPAFMAPELATHSHAIGPYTDIYMLGCVGYWLLSGELVFTGATPVSVLCKHISDEPVPVSRRTELDVPPDLEQLIMDCLAKDPNARPSSVLEVQERLEELVLQRPWNGRRGRAWWEKHRPSSH